MGKRFIDTGLFDDEWFSELSTNAKLLWIYYLTKCDHAGMLKYNQRLIEFQTGLKSIETVLEQLGNRLLKVNEVYLFCPKFIQFQYPEFPNSKVKQQASAVKILQTFGIMDADCNFIDLSNSSVTVKKDLTKSYVYDNGNDNETVKAPKEVILIPDIETFVNYGITLSNKDYTMALQGKYEQWKANAWKDGNGKAVKDWKAKLKNTIPFLKPFQSEQKEYNHVRGGGRKDLNGN